MHGKLRAHASKQLFCTVPEAKVGASQTVSIEQAFNQGWCNVYILIGVILQV